MKSDGFKIYQVVPCCGFHPLDENMRTDEVLQSLRVSVNVVLNLSTKPNDFQNQRSSHGINEN